MILPPKKWQIFKDTVQTIMQNKRFVHTLNFYICEIWHTNWTSNNVLVSYDYKWIYSRVSIQKNFERCENLSNVYI